MIKALALAASIALFASPVLAEPTHVMVRARAQDAKFIGDHVGGVQVTLTDAQTGKTLAKGLIKGGTGDTTRIMKTPRVRGARITDGDTAGFEATLDLAEPTLVRVEATGPIGKPAASIKVSSTLWVIPGHDVLGDGIVLQFPGLVVDPTAAQEPNGAVRLQAKISPMCGCPIDAGGLWDAANYTVHATLLRGHKVVAETNLTFAGSTGEFAGALPAPAAGRYTLQFVATDRTTSNAGVATQSIKIGR